MNRWLLSAGLLAGSLLAMPAMAQQFLGQAGAQCSTPVTPLGFPITLAQNAPGGSSLVVAVALSSNFVSGVTITDPIGTRYQALAGAQSNASGTLVYFRGALQRSLSAGQSLQLSLDGVGSNVSACVSVLAYSGIAFGQVVQESFGSSSGVSSLVEATTIDPGTTSRKLVLGGFISAADPGPVSATIPAIALPTQCTGAQPFCMVNAYYFDDPSSAPMISLGLTNSVTWTAVVTSLQADGIFGNGFD
jgi:hypothetical protein